MQEAGQEERIGNSEAFSIEEKAKKSRFREENLRQAAGVFSVFGILQDEPISRDTLRRWCGWRAMGS